MARISLGIRTPKIYLRDVVCWDILPKNWNFKSLNQRNHKLLLKDHFFVQYFLFFSTVSFFFSKPFTLKALYLTRLKCVVTTEGNRRVLKSLLKYQGSEIKVNLVSSFSHVLPIFFQSIKQIHLIITSTYFLLECFFHPCPWPLTQLVEIISHITFQYLPSLQILHMKGRTYMSIVVPKGLEKLHPPTVLMRNHLVQLFLDWDHIVQVVAMYWRDCEIGKELWNVAMEKKVFLFLI